VGFGDLSYFDRAFRRGYAATPTEIRQSAMRPIRSADSGADPTAKPRSVAAWLIGARGGPRHHSATTRDLALCPRVDCSPTARLDSPSIVAAPINLGIDVRFGSRATTTAAAKRRRVCASRLAPFVIAMRGLW